ncbi:Ornithine aminotransferase [Fusarium falciforme]|nr:Ornithine aminotransferase [Fusarium falciforme]WAO91475.1 Ornithine aminotransferase [Fusarium falciforme]
MLTTEEYAELSARYCAPTHLPIPIVIHKGEGARLRDIDGKEYIDFLSSFSVANQGHSHPRIVKAMIDQCQKIALCTSALQNETYPLLCKKICDLLGYDMAASMNSGSEGVDMAIKIARKWGYNVKGIEPDQAKVLTVTGNYHGKTLGPVSGSSFSYAKDGFGPLLPNIGPNVAGFEVRFTNLDDIKKAFETSGKELAAVLIECVQGFAGCLPTEPGYLQAVQELCREHNVLLIADEIQTGFGRTGTLMAYQHDGIKPDLVVIGKALTGGLYPMSMVLGSKTIMTQIHIGVHTSTFAANPLASAVGIAAVDVVISEGLAERSRRLGAELKDRLNSISSPHTTVKATGRGLFCALHIDESHPSGRVTAERLSRLMRKLGVVIIAVGNRLRIAPPLVIREEDLWKGVNILEEALSKLIYVEDI